MLNIKFTVEMEVTRSLSHLDILSSQNSKGSTTAVYHKFTFSREFRKFHSRWSDIYITFYECFH